MIVFERYSQYLEEFKEHSPNILVNSIKNIIKRYQIPTTAFHDEYRAFKKYEFAVK